ncbi:MAG: lysophospholipid acyltransferase family protein [Chlamydiota bacterium]
MAPPQRSEGLRENALRFVLRRIVPRLILLLGGSIRMTRVNDRMIRERGERGEGCIFSFWHNRFLLMPHIYQKYRGRKNICVMTSQSRDGQYISDVLNGFGFAVARGSTSKGGEMADMEMASMLQAGMDAAVTPDGPRGPRYCVQSGIILVAQLSGMPIIPASTDVSRKKRLKSWDRFVVPMPFSRGALVFGDPVWVPVDAGAAGREIIRSGLEKAMRELDRQAAGLLGAEPD